MVGTRWSATGRHVISATGHRAISATARHGTSAIGRGISATGRRGISAIDHRATPASVHSTAKDRPSAGAGLAEAAAAASVRGDHHPVAGSS